MADFINCGNGPFAEMRGFDIFVDKSMLISNTNKLLGKDFKFICVSRPRRFGKTMAANMIAAYYDESCDSRALFSDLKIANDPSFEKHLNKYPVVFLDIGGFISDLADKSNITRSISNAVLKELQDVYSSILTSEEDTVAKALQKVQEETGKKFVFVIDEWDAIFREFPNDLRQQEDYLNFLRSLFKNNRVRSSIALCYMTGILPIKKYNTESALNNFQEFTMLAPLTLAPFVGFTEPEVKELCSRFDMDFDELKRWYDGYSFSSVRSVYSPYSVVKALYFKEIKNYWTDTASANSAKDYINMNFDGLRDDAIRMLAGQRCKVDTDSFANDFVTLHDKNQVMTLLIHLGYLAYDSETSEAYIPNMEVSEKISKAITDSDWGFASDAIKQSRKLLDATWALDVGEVSRIIESFHDELSSFMSYNKESDLALVIKLAYFAAERYYLVKREMASGKGFADVSFVPRKNTDVLPMIIELKWNLNAEAAIDQIKAREYAKAFPEYHEVLVCGINYDTDGKKHSCRIEKITT